MTKRTPRRRSENHVTAASETPADSARAPGPAAAAAAACATAGSSTRGVEQAGDRVAGSGKRAAHAASRGFRRWTVIRGSSADRLAAAACPSKPTRSTSTPCAASARAWYRMRALRPRSPSATTAALIAGTIVREAATILPATAFVPETARAGWRRRGGDTRRSSGCRRSARSPRPARRCASSIDAPAASAASVRGARTTVGATLPSAMRGAGPIRGGRRAAITTFEIAWPRACRPSGTTAGRATRGISIATISSSGRRTVCAVAGVERRERHAPRAGGARQHDASRRRRPAPAACRRPATRWRRCRRACRDSESARRRPRAPPRPASAARLRTSGDRMSSV